VGKTRRQRLCVWGSRSLLVEGNDPGGVMQSTVSGLANPACTRPVLSRAKFIGGFEVVGSSETMCTLQTRTGG